MSELMSTRPSAPRTVVVGTGSTLVFNANKDRYYAPFVNNSDEQICLSLGVPAILGAGIPLNAAGGSYEIVRNMNDFRGAVYAICASGAKNLAVQELSRAD